MHQVSSKGSMPFAIATCVTVSASGQEYLPYMMPEAMSVLGLCAAPHAAAHGFAQT